MTPKVLKCKAAGGQAFPRDFDWVCPACGRENRAFQLPPTAGTLYTLAQLREACMYCSHELETEREP